MDMTQMQGGSESESEQTIKCPNCGCMLKVEAAEPSEEPQATEGSDPAQALAAAMGGARR